MRAYNAKINMSRWIFVLLLAHHLADAQPRNTQPPAAPNSNGPYWGDSSQSLVTIFVIVIITFFMVGFFCVILHGCIDLPTANPSAADGGIRLSRRRGLDQAKIETFPVFTYSTVKEIKLGREALECAVCLSEFEDDDTLRLIPGCDHVFHRDCIDVWLASHATCPVCRMELAMGSTKRDKSTNTPLIATPQMGSNRVNDVINIINEIAISVNEEDRTEQRPKITGKYPRSHSTGHSVVQVQPGDCTERFTLKLPQEVRRQMLATTKLNRTVSFNVVLRCEGSSGKGYKSDRGEERSYLDKWMYLMTQPSLVSKSPKGSGGRDGGGSGGCDEEGSSNGRALLTAVKLPLNCRNVKVEEIGETSALPPV